jgi:class 3 adenylate cyclase
MRKDRASVDGEAAHVQRALLSHLRQEFTAPVTAIVGYVDILIDDAQRLSLSAYLPDLERIRNAGHALHELLQSVLAQGQAADAPVFNAAKLRHDLRTPLNAIKGYGEMLAEDAADAGHDALLADLTRTLTAAKGMLEKIDALVAFKDRPAEQQLAPPAADIGGIAQAVRSIRSVTVPIAAEICGRILVVDDNTTNRDLLVRQLARSGHDMQQAEGGSEALARLERDHFDLILLDLMMPGMSGFEVLCRLKEKPETREIPVIMISALDDLDSIVRCIEAGAIDYLPKPFDPTLLRARIGASLENKLLRDREKIMMEEIKQQKARNEALLLSILPRSVVDRIHDGATMIADHVEQATILFADLVNFTQFAGHRTPGDLVKFLDEIFSKFDGLTHRFGGEKIKTIGDAYMVAFGLPEPLANHAEAAALMAQAMLGEINSARGANNALLNLRIGIHTGPMVAGVIGQRKFSFDVWGNTVNIASRMESHGEPGRIHVSEAFARELAGRFQFQDRGEIQVKGSGVMRTFFLNGPLAAGAS